jgi:hypothetical protein
VKHPTRAVDELRPRGSGGRLLPDAESEPIANWGASTTVTTTLLRTSSAGLSFLILACGCMPLADLPSYSEGPAQQQDASSTPAIDPGAANSLESSPTVVPTPRDMPANEENAASNPALDVTSADMATGAAASRDAGSILPGDVGATVPSDAGAPAPPPVARDCVSVGGFTTSSTSPCYSFTDATLSWQRARALCQAWGGDLVEIDSASENEALAALVTGTVWIGANDQEQEGAFRWVGGDVADYTAWAVNQPDDWEGLEDCAELSGFDHLWNDRPCTDSFAKQALCEEPQPSSSRRGD